MEKHEHARTPLIHVGRQAIYDRAGDVVAYELLFRDAAESTHATRRSAEATGRVIVAAFTDFGLPQLAQSRACFINVTREFLVGDLPVPFDANQAVLEIVETVDVDEAVIIGVTELVQRGFTIALDDYRPGTHDRLLDFATYVKVDLLDADPAEVADVVQRVRGSHPYIQLIAERLESEADLQRALELGFEFFQGHVLGRPHVVSTAALSPTRLARIRLLTALSSSEVDIDEVAELIAADPALTYRLLQATNSAASGLTARVASVRAATMLLGLSTVRQWVVLMLVSDMAEADEEQIAGVLTRARMCQSVAEQLGLPGDAAFSVGVLAGIAELLGRPASSLAGELPLSADVTAALAERAGGLGRVLAAVRAYEAGDPTGLAELIDVNDATRAYLAALRWCTDITQGQRESAATAQP